MKYLEDNRIIYRREPITDKPSEIFEWGSYYESGTHQCYTLFNTKAKINTYKSLMWHLLVLWYLNPQLTPDDFEKLARYIVEKENGFVTFSVSNSLLEKIIYEVSMHDLERPPKNKIRKVIFKDFSGLTISEKLSIVGTLIGRSKKAEPDDIYETMLYLHDINQKITITKLAQSLKVSTRTIYRSMTEELKKEKELLNKQL
jgi:predicted transcriptional regulator